MTVVSALSPISLTQFFYQSGKIVRPARLFFYAPSTEDRVTVYTDPGLGVAHDQPVLSGGSGRVPPIYVGEEPYRVRIYDSFGALIEDIDYLPGATATSTTSGTTTPPEKLIQTGDYIIQFANGGPRTGFVRANGGLIGPTGFTGVGFTDIERQNDDTYALFKHLWGQDTAGTLAVVPSKGVDADSDWFSNAKMIHLPDLCGRAPVGIDGMGLANKNRLTGAAITGAQTAPGAYGGAATAVMTAAQLATHAHNITPSYTFISIVGAYTGISINDPTHSHSYNAFRAAQLGGTSGVTGTGDGAFVTTQTAAVGTGISIVDPTHNHAITDPTHTHAIGSTGSSSPLPTTGPFSLATFYIKL